MARTALPRWHRVLAGVLLVTGVWALGDFLTACSAVPQTFIGVHGDRLRLTLGFRVNPEAVQGRLPAPWRLHPPASGPFKGANVFVVLVDRVRDDDAEGKPRAPGTDRIINVAVPARYPETDETASVILGGWASTPANVPGFYQVYRKAAVRVEHALKSQDEGAEEVMELWEVQDTAGTGGMQLRLQALRKADKRVRDRGEAQVVSAKDPTLRQVHKFEGATDMVKSIPEGVDAVQHYTFRLTAPEYSTLFDGSEQLIGISVTPWFVRQVFVR